MTPLRTMIVAILAFLMTTVLILAQHALTTLAVIS